MMLNHGVEGCGCRPAWPVNRPRGGPVGHGGVVLSIPVPRATICPRYHGGACGGGEGYSMVETDSVVSHRAT